MTLKVKLISSIMAFCLILGMLIVGVFAIRNTSLNVSGSIKFTATGINATVTDAAVSGVTIGDLSTKMPDLTFSTKPGSDDTTGWGQLGDLEFVEEGGSVKPVSISFKITNTDEKEMLYILTNITDPAQGSEVYSKFLISTSVSDTQYGASQAINLPTGENVVFTITLSLFDVDVDLTETHFNVNIGLYVKSALPEEVKLASATSDGYTYDNIKYTKKTDNTLELTDGQGFTGTNLVIPRTLKIEEGSNTYVCAVTSIKDGTINEEAQDPIEAFSGAFSMKEITSLTLPNTLISIGDAAFGICPMLTGELLIPSSVTSIGMASFAYTGFSGDLVIPSSVTEIGAAAFGGCTGLTGTLTLPNHITEIPASAFAACGFTGELYLPNVITVGEVAFSQCGFTSVNLPKVTSIGKHAFAGCSGLESVTIGPNITNIEDYAFSDCTSLTTVTIMAEAVPTLGSDAFKYRYGGRYEILDLVTIYVPSGSVEAYKAADNWIEYANNGNFAE